MRAFTLYLALRPAPRLVVAASLTARIALSQHGPTLRQVQRHIEGARQRRALSREPDGQVVLRYVYF